MKIAKESYPIENVSGFDEAKYEKLEQELELASSEATKENLVGFLYTTPIADGEAKYRVIKDNGDNDITLQHINIGDAWNAPAALLRGLKRNDLLQLMRWNESLNSLKTNKKESQMKTTLKKIEESKKTAKAESKIEKPEVAETVLSEKMKEVIQKMKKLTTDVIVKRLIKGSFEEPQKTAAVELLKIRGKDVRIIEVNAYIDELVLDAHADTNKVTKVMEVIGETKDLSTLSETQIEEIIAIRDERKAKKIIPPLKKEHELAGPAKPNLGKETVIIVRRKDRGYVDPRCSFVIGDKVEFDASKNSKLIGKRLNGEVIRPFYEERTNAEWLIISVTIDKDTTVRMTKKASMVTKL